MADLYNFTDDEYCVIDFLKKFVVIKYGNFRSFKLKKEKDKHYKIITLYAKMQIIFIKWGINVIFQK